MLTKELEMLLHHQATGYYDARNYEKASGLFRFLTLFCPTNSNYWFGLGSSLMLSGNDLEAVQPFLIATVHAPNDPKACMHLGECYARLGQVQEAQNAFTQADSLCKKYGTELLLNEITVLKKMYGKMYG
jgi:Flp pilus assembly protein TadD